MLVANANGLVAVTDSRLSNQRGPQGSGQKLFLVDDHTICTVAGFYMDSGAPMADAGETPVFPAYTSISSLLSKYFEVFRGQRVKVSIDPQDLAQALVYSLDMVANSDSVSGLLRKPTESDISIAGYESGRLYIQQINLVPEVSKQVIRYKTYIQPKIYVGNTLTRVTAGITTTANLIFDDPMSASVRDPIDDRELPKADQVISDLAKELQANGGKDLTLSALEDIARDVEARTAARYRVEVGGLVQVAILADGHVQTFKEPITEPQQSGGLAYVTIEGNHLDNGSAFSGNRQFVLVRNN